MAIFSSITVSVVFGVRLTVLALLKGAASYTELCKIPREYNSEANSEEITWTYVSIQAGYRKGLIQRRKAFGILCGTR
jgi:hypothetical protein